jgi:hypothetical protein
MNTLQLVYNIVSGLLLAFTCFAWSSKNFLNIFIKMTFFCAMALGIVVLVRT